MEAKPDLKAMTGKERASYIWDYYKLHILSGLVVFIIAVIVIFQIATYKDSALNILMVDSYNPYGEEPEGISEFFKQEGLDGAKQKISVEFLFSGDKMELSMKLTVGETDVFIAPDTLYNEYALSGCMADLTDYFTAEELEQYGDLLYYTTDSETNESYPCGILLTDNPWIIANGYGNITCCFGITHNSESAVAADFLRFVLTYP